MICLTGDVHHSSLGTNDQCYLSGGTEVRIAARYARLAEAHGVKLTFYVTGKTLVEEWRDFQTVAVSPSVEIGGHTYGGIPQTWWKKVWNRLRGLQPPFVSTRATCGSARSGINAKTVCWPISWSASWPTSFGKPWPQCAEPPA